MTGEKSLGDMLNEFMSESSLSFMKKEYHDAWPVVSGPRLSACTILEKVSESEGKIFVRATSPSAKSLLTMERTRIVGDWNRMFPERKIREVVVIKRT